MGDTLGKIHFFQYIYYKYLKINTLFSKEDTRSICKSTSILLSRRKGNQKNENNIIILKNCCQRSDTVLGSKSIFLSKRLKSLAKIVE